MDVKVTELVGETISSVELIHAEPGRSNMFYLLFTTESGKRAIQGVLAVTQKTIDQKGGPDPSVSEMLAASNYFTQQDIAAKADRDVAKEAARISARRQHAEKELAKLQKELGIDA